MRRWNVTAVSLGCALALSACGNPESVTGPSAPAVAIRSEEPLTPVTGFPKTVTKRPTIDSTSPFTDTFVVHEYESVSVDLEGSAIQRVSIQNDGPALVNVAVFGRPTQAIAPGGTITFDPATSFTLHTTGGDATVTVCGSSGESS